MSSKGHDFILETVQMKMKQLGYRIVASDSHYKNIKFDMPPTIKNHRPDAVGYSDNNSICIGEAKYYGDLDSERSQTQIIDFINLTLDKKMDIRVVFGIPLSEEETFLEVLRKNDLDLSDRVILLKVPDRLIPREDTKNEEI